MGLSRDPAGETTADPNPFPAFGNDPINNADPTGLYFRPASAANDAAAELPGYRSYAQVWAEARAEVAAKYGSLPDSAVVIKRHILSDKTFGDLIASVESAKESWYVSNGILLESSGEYAKDLAASQDPGGMYADNRPMAEIQAGINAQETIAAVENGQAPASAAVAADIVARHPGGVPSLFGAVWEATGHEAPELAAAIAGVQPTTGSPVVVEELLPANLTIRGQSTILSPANPPSVMPPQLEVGAAHEADRLAELGLPVNTTVWRPTEAQIDTAAFKVIVGEPKYTPTGLPVGTRPDAAQAGTLEIKGGTSILDSSYQMRLQVFRSLTQGTPLTIDTTRPLNPTFQGWLERWGVTVTPPKQ